MGVRRRADYMSSPSETGRNPCVAIRIPPSVFCPADAARRRSHGV